MNDALPPQHTKAMQIVADAKENIARIRARTDLVPEAKEQRIARVYLDATGKLEPLRAEYEAGETNRLARRQRKAFALPLGDSMAAASYRDALDRFGRLRDVPGENAEEQALVIIDPCGPRRGRVGDPSRRQRRLRPAVDQGHRPRLRTGPVDRRARAGIVRRAALPGTPQVLRRRGVRVGPAR